MKRISTFLSQNAVQNSVDIIGAYTA